MADNFIMHDFVLTIKNLSKSYVKGKLVNDHISLSLGRGEIFGLLGPNGAGKTTTLRMLATLIPIDSGEATVVTVDVRPGGNK